MPSRLDIGPKLHSQCRERTVAGATAGRWRRIYTGAVPLERHWERQNTPLRGMTRRERLIVASVTMVACIVAVGVVVGALRTGAGPAARAGCVHVTAAGNTGGYVLRLCDGHAITFCRQQASRTDDFARQARQACRKARVAAGM